MIFRKDLAKVSGKMFCSVQIPRFFYNFLYRNRKTEFASLHFKFYKKGIIEVGPICILVGFFILVTFYLDFKCPLLLHLF